MHLGPIAFSLLAALCAPTWLAQTAPEPPGPCQYSFTTERLHTDAGQVPVELYRPLDSASHPLIVMLHGSVGVFTHPEDEPPKEDNFGERRLAQSCFVVALPHYLEPFGMKSITSMTEMRRMFPSIVTELQDIVRQLENLPGVEKKIGLYGESYGGYLAAALATVDPAVRAVSEYGGGAPAGYSFHRSAPPFLIQHGEADTLVPLAEAQGLQKQVMASGAPAILVIYPGQTHYFDGKTRAVVLERSTDFFLGNLK